MSKPLRQLLSAWLVIVLAAAPLPVFSAPQAADGDAHCMSGQMHSRHASVDLPAHHPAELEQDQAPAPCRHCTDDSCANGACPDCSPCHAANPIAAAVFSPALTRFSEVRPFVAANDLVSLSYPPLLHPPSLPVTL